MEEERVCTSLVAEKHSIDLEEWERKASTNLQSYLNRDLKPERFGS